MRLLMATALLLSLAAPVAPAGAQTTGAGFDAALSPSLAAVARNMHATIRRDLAEAAALMTDADYSFRPTDATRTVGQLVGHVASANFFFWSQAAGEPMPTQTNFEAQADRSTVLKGLQDSLAYCDKVYGATTDATYNQQVKMGGPPGAPPTVTVRGAVLQFNTAHNNEHYGNLVVYMRLRGKVPPSTARTQSR
jgi:uncharacterized damage-inducible protein DinB